MSRLVGIALLGLAACGDAGFSFVAAPWPAEHSVVVVSTDLSGEPISFRQSQPGLPLELEPPKNGRLFARAYAPDASLLGRPLSECPVELASSDAQLYPRPASSWITNSLSDDALPVFEVESTPRDFALGSSACDPPPFDVCAALTFEDIPIGVNDGFEPISVVALGEGRFMVGGENERFRQYSDTSTFAQWFLPRRDRTVVRMASHHDEFFYALLEDGDLIRVSLETQSEVHLASGMKGLTGSDQTIIAYDDNQAFELIGETLDRLIAPPARIVHFAVWNRNSGSLQTPSDVFRWDVTGWTTREAPSLPGGARLVGTRSRVAVLGPDGYLITSPGSRDWSSISVPELTGFGSLVAAADTEKSFFVVGDGVLGINQSRQWCIRQDSRYRYKDITRLDDNSIITVSSYDATSTPRILKVSD